MKMEAEKRQDINVCRTCEYFRDLNDPKMNDGKWHWGVGFMCACHGKMVPWRSERPDAVAETEDEFEKSHIYFAGRRGRCKQHPDEPKMTE